MTLPIKNTGWRRALATNSTSTAFSTTLTGQSGIFTKSEIQADLDAGELAWLPINKSLVAQIIWFGQGTNNTDFDCRITLTMPLLDASGQRKTTDPYVFFLLGNIVSATLDTSYSGVAGSTVLDDSDKICDAVTYTPGNMDTHWTAAMADGVTKHVSALTAVALTSLTNLGRATGMILDFDLTGATNCNALVMMNEF